MLCYEVIAGEEVSKDIKSLLAILKPRLNDLLDKKALISYDKNIKTTCYVDCLRYFVDLPLESFTNRTLVNLYLSHLNHTERNSAGSGIIFTAALCDYLSRGIREKAIGHSWSTIKTHTFTGKRPFLADVENIMSKFGNDSVAKLTLKAIQSVGAEGSITVDHSKNIQRTALEIDNRYRFASTPSEVFIQQTGRTRFELMSPKVMTIDGFVESTSEIDHIMRDSFDSGQPLILATRGFHPDVSNTLAHNYVHGKLRVVPVEVRYDEIGANSLIDMSKVCGSNFINSLKGDLIVSTSSDDAGSADSVLVENDAIFISKQKIDNQTVYRQRMKINKKIDEAETEIQKKVLESRLNSLTPVHCKVTIKTSDSMSGLEKDRVTNLMRIFNDTSKFGYVDLTSIEPHDSYFIEDLLKTMTDKGINRVPTSALNEGIRSAAVCAESFLRVGACLLIDE